MRDPLSPQSRGYTKLRLGPDVRPQIVDALITGMHDPGTSHDRLLEAFCARPILFAAMHIASGQDFRSHEYGDLMLVPANRSVDQSALR